MMKQYCFVREGNVITAIDLEKESVDQGWTVTEVCTKEITGTVYMAVKELFLDMFVGYNGEYQICVDETPFRKENLKSEIKAVASFLK